MLNRNHRKKSACESMWHERTWLHYALFPDVGNGGVGKKKIRVRLKRKAEPCLYKIKGLRIL